MKVNLVPLRFKKVMWTVRKIAIIGEVLTALLLLIIGVLGIFADTITAIVFSLSCLSITALLMIPGFLYEKISQSNVEFTADKLRVLDRHGNCWREISYDSITAIRIDEIAGFFYGKDRDMNIEKYICFFFNDTSVIPDIPYTKLFKSKDFFVVGYQEDALDLIKQIIPSMVDGDIQC